MTNVVRTMLENMYDLFQREYLDAYQAWDNMVAFIAGDYSLDYIWQNKDSLKSLLEKKTLMDKVMNVYDHTILKNDYYDHLGDLYLEKIVSSNTAKQRGQFVTPHAVGSMMSRMIIPKTEKKITILDPAVGSGRLLMEAYKQAPNSIPFGVDLDLRMVRIAMTNFVIHGIKGYLLHANSLEHELDLSKQDGIHNWRYANKWESHIGELKTISHGENLELNLR